MSAGLALPLVLGGFAVSMGSILHLSYHLDKRVTYARNDNNELQPVFPPGYMATLGAFFVAQGCSIGPLLCVLSPQLALSAAVISSATMGGMYAFARWMPSGSLLPYGSALMVSLWGLLGVSIGGFWFPALHTIDAYGGVALFAALTAYDVQNAIQSVKGDQPNHWRHAIEFHLNFLNLFVRFVEILGKSKK